MRETARTSRSRPTRSPRSISAPKVPRAGPSAAGVGTPTTPDAGRTMVGARVRRYASTCRPPGSTAIAAGQHGTGSAGAPQPLPYRCRRTSRRLRSPATPSARTSAPISPTRGSPPTAISTSALSENRSSRWPRGPAGSSPRAALHGRARDAGRGLGVERRGRPLRPAARPGRRSGSVPGRIRGGFRRQQRRRVRRSVCRLSRAIWRRRLAARRQHVEHPGAERAGARGSAHSLRL